MPTSVSSTAVEVVGSIVEVPSQDGQDVAEKSSLDKKTPLGVVDITTAAVPEHDDNGHEKDNGGREPIIVTGADAAAHLLPMRDDGDASLTFRSLFLASGLSAFQAVMSQIYMVRGDIIGSLVWVTTD